MRSDRSCNSMRLGRSLAKTVVSILCYAKIFAARELGIPVVMIQRPPIPPGDIVAEIESVLVWLKNRLLRLEK
jgi:precorrin-6A/cobalt-precorrin-6A reductase